MTESNLPERKDLIIKDHSNHTHKMTIIYPNATVQNMKASWRKALEERGEWLEKYSDRISGALESGFNMIDEEAEKAQKEIEKELLMKDEELFDIFKKRHLEYIEEKQTFIKDKEKRKEELEKEIKSQMEGMKKQVVEDIKEKKDALKMWDNVKTNK